MTFATFDLFAAVVARDAAHLGRLDRLAVDATGAGGLVSASGLTNGGPEGINDLLPGAVLLPGDEVIPDGTLGGQVVRQVVPLAAGTGLVEQRVDHFAQIHGARPATRLGGRQQGLDQLPLSVRQVRSI